VKDGVRKRSAFDSSYQRSAISSRTENRYRTKFSVKASMRKMVKKVIKSIVSHFLFLSDFEGAMLKMVKKLQLLNMQMQKPV
jgi:hypothetical protein